ncbi:MULTISPECIES: hypothetical protein [Agrobacterium]|uniref:hypothetical protein n=1 Tax=Agrobacterium TaxID=357 RepID=UPI0022B852F4|nr:MULTISPECIES: hypothetical protein [Agrobacterium]MCZ7975026.1 hypothetical protein [Agrobacterium salinitolerans]MEA1843045.1 hypothetical protein [Agrobacterium tumefaciens]
MTISQSTFSDIFAVVEKVIEQAPDYLALDPIADLKAKPVVRIQYTRKPKLNASSAFMTFKSKGSKNWIGLLLGDLCHFVTGAQADIAIMHSSASAKSSSKHRAQTWHEFVSELYTDKIINRNDISEAQAKQLVKLLELLSANGFKLKGCGTLEFVDETGEVLA